MARIALLVVVVAGLPLTAQARVRHLHTHLHRNLHHRMHVHAHHVAPWAMRHVRRAPAPRHVDVPETASNTRETSFKPEGLPGIGAGFTAARQMQQNWNGLMLAE